jgi:hypothetical protein
VVVRRNAANPLFRLRQQRTAGAISSVTAGFKYEVNDNVSITTLAGYENRMSNVTDKDHEKFIAGACIDFNIDFARQR